MTQQPDTMIEGVADPDTPDDPAGSNPPAEPEQRQPRFGRGLYAGLAVVLTLLLAGGLAALVVLQRSGAGVAEEQIEEIAARFVQNLHTFDYRTLDEDIARIRADATGNFQGELESALGGDITLFRDTITEAEARSAGSVHAVVVRSVTEETARATVFVDQTIRNTQNPEPRTVLRRIELTLVETTSGWKVDEVQAPGVGPA